MNKLYRIEAPEAASDIVPALLCRDCQHGTTIVYRSSGKYAYMACKVRAMESLEPHESELKLEREWSQWNTGKWNDEGQCDRWETAPVVQSLWLRFKMWLFGAKR